MGDDEAQLCLRRQCEKVNRLGLTRVVRRQILRILALVVIALVRGHHLDAELAIRRRRNDIPEAEGPTPAQHIGQRWATAVGGRVFWSEQGVDQGIVDACCVFSIQFFHRSAQHALDTGGGQVGHAVGRQKSKAVFHRVRVAQAGGKGRGGDCIDHQPVGGRQALGQRVLALAQGLEYRCRITQRATV